MRVTPGSPPLSPKPRLRTPFGRKGLLASVQSLLEVRHSAAGADTLGWGELRRNRSDTVCPLGPPRSPSEESPSSPHPLQVPPSAVPLVVPTLAAGPPVVQRASDPDLHAGSAAISERSAFYFWFLDRDPSLRELCSTVYLPPL